MDDLFRGELRKNGRQDRFVQQLGHVHEELGGKVLSTHEVDKFADLVGVDHAALALTQLQHLLVGNRLVSDRLQIPPQHVVMAVGFDRLDRKLD